MGLDASIQVVSREDVRHRRFLADAAGLAKFELNRAWTDLLGALETFGLPLNLAVRGDRPLTDDDDDCTHALVTPALVKRIHGSLGAVSEEEFLAAIQKDRKKTGGRLQKYEHKGLLATLANLKAAYRMAAEEDAYIEIFIC